MQSEQNFREFLEKSNPFQQYLYSYPHKTAYRPLEKEVALRELWKSEKRDALYLYSHIPFCRSKCSFCNLFSLSNPQENLIESYLETLKREADTVSDFLGDHSFSGYAIGGGTPSLLTEIQLEKLFRIYSDTLNVDMKKLPGSFEISPNTVTLEKLKLIRSAGIDRVSIGVQSFLESEAKLMGRVQPGEKLTKVLRSISSLDFPTFNIDLIYGIKGQTKESMIESLKKAMEFNPNEIFLYPLYTRPLTPLFSLDRTDGRRDHRMELYKTARDFLFAEGFEQSSMRMFSRSSGQKSSSYSCQEDGMIGLGVNARSYTKAFHYSTEYAVKRDSSLDILNSYISQKDFSFASHGIDLSVNEQKRRYLIKSLLKAEGINLSHYKKLFGTDLQSEFPELPVLADMDLTVQNQDQLRLTAEGLALSDLIGYWFISDSVKTKMREYSLK